MPRLVCLVATLVGVGYSVRAQQPTLDEVLARLSAYLLQYEQKLSTVVAEEHYRRQLRLRPGASRIPAATESRTLTSDFVLLRLPGGHFWLGFRDTFLVDGKPVRDRDVRLEQVLSR